MGASKHKPQYPGSYYVGRTLGLLGLETQKLTGLSRKIPSEVVGEL